VIKWEGFADKVILPFLLVPAPVHKDVLLHGLPQWTMCFIIVKGFSMFSPKYTSFHRFRHYLARTHLGSRWFSTLLLAALAALVWMRRRRGMRHVSQIADAATRLRDGDLSARTGVTHDDSEVGSLADSFDTMALALQQRAHENDRRMTATQHLNQALKQRVTRRTAQLQESNSNLVTSEAELRRLSQQLMEVTEQERTRLSREIHDQLGQTLTGIKIELVTAKRQLEPGQPLVLKKLEDAVSLVDETIQVVRRIATDMRPGVLDDFGLEAAAEWLLEEFTQRTGIPCALTAQVDEMRLDPALCTAVFRILQETLTNVARHAQATEVQVTLLTDANAFTLVVHDNGRGITEADRRLSKSLGLLGMRERAMQFGGLVSVVGVSNQGTTVTLMVPWQETED
jgi:signal transduction histidine kinase